VLVVATKFSENEAAYRKKKKKKKNGKIKIGRNNGCNRLLKLNHKL
jgi:hypothetical protein